MWYPARTKMFPGAIIVQSILAQNPDAITNAPLDIVIATSIIHPHQAARSTIVQVRRKQLRTANIQVVSGNLIPMMYIATLILRVSQMISMKSSMITKMTTMMRMRLTMMPRTTGTIIINGRIRVIEKGEGFMMGCEKEIVL